MAAESNSTAPTRTTSGSAILLRVIKLTDLYPGGWEEIARNIKRHRDGLWGTVPDMPAVDLSGLRPPPHLLQAILDRNAQRVRDEINAADLLEADELFDDQLVE